MGITKTVRTLQDKLMLMLFQMQSRLRRLPPDVLRYYLIPYVLGQCRIIGCIDNHWIFGVGGRAYGSGWSFGSNIAAVTLAPHGFLSIAKNRSVVFHSLTAMREVHNGLSAGTWLMSAGGWLTYDAGTFRLWQVTGSGKNATETFEEQPEWLFDVESDVPFYSENAKLFVIRGRSIVVLGEAIQVVSELQARPNFVMYYRSTGTFQPYYPWGSGEHIYRR